MSIARRWRSPAVAVGAVVPLAVALAAAPAVAGSAAPRSGPTGLTKHVNPSSASTARTDAGTDGGETEELMDRAEQYAAVRTAPGQSVSAEAFQAAARQARALPAMAGRWRELTDKPYNSDAVNYRDPFWSNSSGGSGIVSGRMTSIATDGDTVYAGAADGGVWRSTDKGTHWTPLFDRQTRLSIGAITVDPRDHSVWVGTGEANTAFENYSGDGIYRSADRGRTWQLVGNRLTNSLISRITFDGVGHVYAATSNGLVRRSVLDSTAAWTTVLKPDPNPTHSPYRGSWISDVRVKPGTSGKTVVAVLGWRGGTLPDTYAHNGFYESRTGGTRGSFVRVASRGDLDPATIGRTSLDYTANGNKLYAVVESPVTVALTGVYRSESGTAVGPWTLIADNAELAAAPKSATDNPGDQAWYDQYIVVDPKDSSHVYLGLKEVYESSNFGNTWTTIGPYWNFGKACQSFDPALDTCPNTTHPDQHAATVAADGTAYFANDGGMYARPAALRRVVKWSNLNATLRTLQYYYAGIGRVAGGDAVWGGLQDNGTSLLLPGKSTMVSPFGGDGGDVIVDPKNGERAVNEYVDLTMARTQNGGRSDGSRRAYTTITPTCFSRIAIEFHPKPCDQNPRFIAPFEADITNTNHWVAGGQRIWDNQGKGWSTACNDTTCDWKLVHGLGAGAQTTSINTVGRVIYAGWCGNGCNPGGSLPFISGIDTNYGGRWHRVTAPNLPNRIPTSIFIDPSNAAHVYVSYGAFSRRWIAGAGVGHVFESKNGGTSWVDVSGNLPDAPANDILVVHGKLVVGTDVGVFVAGAKGSWMRLGTSLPNASTNDLVVAPSANYLVAATHGRGMWRLDLG